jgi:hypothetical protein
MAFKGRHADPPIQRCHGSIQREIGPNFDIFRLMDILTALIVVLFVLTGMVFLKLR